jgi:hypothetical protein
VVPGASSRPETSRWPATWPRLRGVSGALCKRLIWSWGLCSLSHARQLVTSTRSGK